MENIMKNLIILLVFFTVTLNVLGQDYTPFPTNNGFWSAMHCEPGPYVRKSGLVKVGVFGDTVINSKTYHKLYLQRKYVNNTFSCDTCGFDFDKDSAFYFISFREENKIIYFVPQQNGFDDPSGKEYPVFNFNLSSVGEKIIAYEYVFIPFGTVADPTPTPGCGALQDTVTLTVESIDRVAMSDGTFRRRINFVPLTYGRRESWIEGIGSTKGFGLSLNVTNSNNTAICFSHDGVNLDTKEILSEQLCTRYPDSTMTFANRCEYTTQASADESPGVDVISVFPNPVVNYLKFSGLLPGDKVTIYNLFGQVIFQETTDSKELVFEQFELNNGIYFYIVASFGRDIISGKIIKL